MFDRRIRRDYSDVAAAVIYQGDCLKFLATMPAASVQLIVTSPPYNLGKEYERRSSLESYLEWQRAIIRECHRILKPEGSICWQVGNYVERGKIVPLDIALYPIFAELGMSMRNRIVWHFEHGLHATNRLSGRYETICWFTKSDQYFFNVDPIRVPQKYPGKKHFKGPKAGQYSGNPLGKNPGDVWIFPNVKSNHIEKTEHPCQFPVELVDRLVLAMTQEGDAVLDPFMGAGTAVAAAVRRFRRGLGCELLPEYVRIAEHRITQALDGTLPVREMGTPVFDPKDAGAALTMIPWATVANGAKRELQQKLLERRSAYRTKK